MVKRIAIAEINRIQVLRSKGYSLPEIKKVTSISYGSKQKRRRWKKQIKSGYR